MTIDKKQQQLIIGEPVSAIPKIHRAHEEIWQALESLKPGEYLPVTGFTQKQIAALRAYARVNGFKVTARQGVVYVSKS
jgi:hypothetical protein